MPNASAVVCCQNACLSIVFVAVVVVVFSITPGLLVVFCTCSTLSMAHRVGAFNLMISTHSESVGAEAIELDIIFISNSKFDA